MSQTRTAAVSAMRPMVLGGLTLPNRVFAAPLSGISDVPFRRLTRRFGAGLVFSEMVASGEFVKGCAESAVRAMQAGDGIHAVQLAGRDPQWMERAARQLAESGVDLIDINMGCPAKKVVGGLSGSALMREPELALRIVEATVRGAGEVPVSLKMRLGWDRATMNAAEIAARAEAAGVAMITVHGRTRADFYEGQADWHAIAEVRRAVEVPLVANGDLTRAADLPRMLEASGADAVMVGRGAQGRPWLPGLIAGAVTLDELAKRKASDLVCEHYEAMLAHYGAASGLRHARKHLAWSIERLSAFSGADLQQSKAEILTAKEPGLVLDRLRRLFAGVSLADLETGEASDARQVKDAA
ncbi:MAG: tRNA dihydrouridine synthase DusB [Pseudomonadota bacterium]|nr:tRNA dihydrouridine synthase DusB [Pseudomonadota bacterium]